VNTLNRIDSFLGRNMAILVLICVTLGICFNTTLDVLSALNVPLFAFLTFANSLGGGFREMGRVFLKPAPVVVTLLLLHVVMPLLSLGLGRALFPDAPLFTMGLVLEFAIPTGVSALMWVSLSRGNTALCLSLVMLDTICAPVVVPLTLKLLVGSVVHLDTLGMVKNLMIMVGIPALLAMALYDFSHGKQTAVWKPRLAPFAKVSMLLVVTANATGCSPFLRNLDGTLIKVILAVFTLCLLGFFLGYWSGRLLGQDFPTVQTMTLNTGMRNISAGAVLAQQYFPGDVLFPVAFSPVFLQLTTSLVVKLLRRTPTGRADQADYLRLQAEQAPE